MKALIDGENLPKKEVLGDESQRFNDFEGLEFEREVELPKWTLGHTRFIAIVKEAVFFILITIAAFA